MVRNVLFRGDTQVPITVGIFQQSEEDLASELRGQVVVVDGVGDIEGSIWIMRIELGGDPPYAVDEVSVGGSCHGAPPLIGDLATCEGD
jgi:hypothetical protein